MEPLVTKKTIIAWNNMQIGDGVVVQDGECKRSTLSSMCSVQGRKLDKHFISIKLRKQAGVLVLRIE